MEIDSIINVLLSMGVPGVAVATAVFLSYRFIPKAIEAYRNAKAEELAAHKEMQHESMAHAEKIIEVAAKSTMAIEQTTRVMEHNSDVNTAAVSALSALESAFKEMSELFKGHDRRSEEINVGINRVLESVRREGSP